MEERLAKLRAAVIGTGLIGGSVLVRLHNKGIDAIGWDPDSGTRSYGLDRGLSYAHEIADALTDRNVIFLAGPLSSLPASLHQVAEHAPADCVITDVGSTKQDISRVAEEMGLSSRFIPGHPMAGTERSGLSAADPALFDGASWVLCPYPHEPLGRFRHLAIILAGIFGVRVVPMDPTTHDATVALSSHIPHLLAGALAGGVARSPLRPSVLGLAAGSFRDGSRVAGTPSARTADMLASNREAVIAQFSSVRRFLDDLVTAVEHGDDSRLVDLLSLARSVRMDFLQAEMVPSRRVFGTDLSNNEEHRFLMGLGAAGGYLTRCEVSGSEVTYEFLAPPYTGEREW